MASASKLRAVTELVGAVAGGFPMAELANDIIEIRIHAGFHGPTHCDRDFSETGTLPEASTSDILRQEL